MPSKACIALALAAPAVTAFNFGGFGKKTSAPKPAQKSSGGAYPSPALPGTTTIESCCSTC